VRQPGVPQDLPETAELRNSTANLFPGHTGDMVLDGNVSPLAWADGDANVPTELRMGSDSGSAKTMLGFVRPCGRAAVPVPAIVPFPPEARQPLSPSTRRCCVGCGASR
jgi:hypothetical protein